MDPIDRQAAIDLFPDDDLEWDTYCGYVAPHFAKRMIKELPPAQPEIIRCKDCKYHDEGYRRISFKWLPCMDICQGDNWYCGSAERREE